MSAVLDPTPSAAPKEKLSVELNKLSKRLHRQVGQAIVDFNMIEEGDKVMVCVSGGKDSYALLDILINLRARAPIRAGRCTRQRRSPSDCAATSAGRSATSG